MTKTVPRLLAAILMTVVLAGCGSPQSNADRQAAAFLSAHRLDLLFADCSGSYRQASESFVPTMVEIAQNTAQARRILWAGCFDGAPMRMLVWNPQVDFGEIPSTLSGNPGLTNRFNQARALGLRGPLDTTIRTTPTRVPGSGQLEALELASLTSGVGRVYLFSDAEIHEAGVPSMNTATPAQIAQTVKLWVPRLRGLKGVQLLLIGVGRGVHNAAAVRNAELLFRTIANDVGVASYSWSQTLPADFPVPRI